MRKKILLVCLLSALMCSILTGCGHTHNWKEASCTDAKTCKECGETEGEPLGHDWTDANCTSPKTCARCGVTEGESLGHDWKEATCAEPKTCVRCGATEGETLGHETPGLSCTEGSTCTRCGKEVSALGHDWKEATCIEPKTCSRCGATEGAALGHTASDPKKENQKAATCTEDGHYDEVVYCSVCNTELSRETKTEGMLGHTTANGTCSRCGTYIIEPIVFSGSGDTVISNINVPQGVYKVVLNNQGRSNFIVHAYKANGDRLSSLANEIGNYEGAIFLSDNIDGGILEVKSSGNWTISFEMIPNGGTSNISGSGDWVSPWFTIKSGALVVTMTNNGSHNFIVHIYDENGNRYSSLANEIGEYSGETVFNRGRDGLKYCIEVISSGDWTVDFGLGDALTSK